MSREATTTVAEAPPPDLTGSGPMFHVTRELYNLGTV